MKKLIVVIVICVVLPMFSVAQDTLFVYGPSGPFAAVDECAKAFGKQNKIAVKVVAGPEANWNNVAKQNADIIYGGAEYMLTEFAMKNKGLVDSTTRTKEQLLFLSVRVILNTFNH